MVNSASNLVHESETQRQYVRVHLPARARIEGVDYEVTDISSGGISLQNVDKAFKANEKINLLVILPFKDFSLDIDLNAEVRHFDKKKNTLGARFINMTPEKTSLLNHVLRSFIAGEVVAGNDILNVVSRDNFVKVRHHENVESDADTFMKRQALPLLFILLLGLTAFFIIAKNLYSGLFVLESAQAYVSGEEIKVRTPTNGTYSSLIEGDLKSVQAGQDIASIQPYNGSLNFSSSRNSAISLTRSPCDCYILDSEVNEGEFVNQGSDIVTLIKTSSTPWVTAIVSTRDAQRIGIGDTAEILLLVLMLKLKVQFQALKSMKVMVLLSLFQKVLILV